MTRTRRLLPAVLFPAALLLGPATPAAALPHGPPAAAQAQAPGTAQEPPVPTPDVLETPAPIVPEGDTLGRIGVVAMIVVAVAGLFIYRVIRKGL